MSGTRFTDNEIKSKVVKHQDIFRYWQLGFWRNIFLYRISGHVHKEMAGIISSFVCCLGADSVFGDLFQITTRINCLYLMSVEDVDIILYYTDKH